MHRLLGIALLGSTALYPAVAAAQDTGQQLTQEPLAWQQMNECQQLVAFAEQQPAQAPLGPPEAQELLAQGDLDPCRQLLGQIDQTAFGQFEQDYDAQFAGQQMDQPSEGTATVTIQQQAPQVTVPQPQVTVTQAAPEIIVRQQAPTITVLQAQPEIIVRIPELDIDVDVAQPQVSVGEGEPAIDMAEQPQPQVTFEEIGEPQIVFERAEGEPQITFERLAAAEQPEATDELAQAEQQPEATDELAQADQPDAMQQETAGADPQMIDPGEAALSDPTDVAASDILGRPVVNQDGQQVGEVVALVELTDGQFAAIVAADAYLGIGEHQYAIPLDSLAFAADALVVIDLTDEQLAQSPEWNQAMATRDITSDEMTQMQIWQAPDQNGGGQQMP